MSVAFMALFSVIIAEYVSISWARKLAIPLMGLGIGSVLYWFVSESHGQGDLRLYALVQFLLLLWIPVFLGCFLSKFTHSYGYWGVLVAYVVSKLCEYLDAEIYALGLGVSGHALKHVVVALGLVCLLWMYHRRKVLSV